MINTKVQLPRFSVGTLFVTILVSSLLLTACSNDDTPVIDSPPTAVCSNGVFIGVQKSHVMAYKGIPYALPPVGALRWKTPVAMADGNNVYDATEFGYVSYQTKLESEGASFLPQSEDCLTLNVWHSINGGSEKKPVIVFIHGGDNAWGGSADSLYDGYNFVDENPDIVFVSINYRLGYLGFIDLSPLEGGEDYPHSGNLGLLDQICALQWVHRNIATFGGDPDNVTIMGESAGGSDVSLLLLVKEAKGLFHRAIVQSGNVSLTSTKKDDIELTEAIMEVTGAKSVNDLLALSGEQLLDVRTELGEWYNYPERDGVVLPEDILQTFSATDFTGIDLLIGTNKDEVKYWIVDINNEDIYNDVVMFTSDYLRKVFEDADKMRYDEFITLVGGDNLASREHFLSDYVFRVPAIYMAETVSAHGGNAYMYLWTKESGDPRLGACHAVELPYVFANPYYTYVTAGEYDEALARRVRQMWVAFAKTGNPSIEAYPWQPYDASTRATMVLGEMTYMENDPLAARRELITPLLPYLFSGRFMLIFSNEDEVTNQSD